MTSGSIRRAQLIAPFGVGAMSVLVDGTSVITAGLDHWFPVDKVTDYREFQVRDWRLEARLKVSGFRLPPEHRSPKQGHNSQPQGDQSENQNLSIPTLRFPRWHFCMYCKALKRSPYYQNESVNCDDKKHKDQKHKPRMAQVPFVVICPSGHIDDFPFNEWVHKKHKPDCNGQLRLRATPKEGLDGQTVECTKCKKSRSLKGVMQSKIVDSEELTTLSHKLTDGDELFLCSGARPWLAQEETTCDKNIRGALKGSGNVYFPKVESSIYLPKSPEKVSESLRKILEGPEVGTIISTLTFQGAVLNIDVLRKLEKRKQLEGFSDEDILAGYEDIYGAKEDKHTSDSGLLSDANVWRHPEFKYIREEYKDDALSTRDPGLHHDLSNYLDRVRLVDTLTETRALRGFTRGYDNLLKLSDGKEQLRRTPLEPDEDWLPAYRVKGEGIFLELNHSKLSSWEKRSEVKDRAGRLTSLYSRVATQRGLTERLLDPRFILLHTLGHLLINELVYTCGYSSASLRERVYASTTPETEMNGILIYTASGDSEGTLGGLVRMGNPDNFLSVLSSTITKSNWCSSDPVCMEAGITGQGPDSCNLAACHCCALVPETSCEEFNRFLDRGLVTGTIDDPTLGFFSDFL